MLHFYYDGFIWKVRERSTRQSLGLAGGTADVTLGGLLPSWAWHGLKWAAIFVVPLGALWFLQTHVAVPEVQRQAWVVADVPVGAKPHVDYATALQKEGRLEEAVEHFKLALQYNPKDAKAHMSLAAALTGLAKFDPAVPHVETALRLGEQCGFHLGYAALLQRIGRNDEAAVHFDTATRLKPDSAEAHYSYAAFLGGIGKNDESISELRRLIQLRPNYPYVQLRLADALFAAGNLQEAKSHYLEALRNDPNSTVAYNNLGKVYLSRARFRWRWFSLVRRYGSIRITRKPKKTCVSPRRVIRSFFSNRAIDLWPAALFISIWMTRAGTSRSDFLWSTRVRGARVCASPRRPAWSRSFTASRRQISRHLTFCGSGDFHYLTALRLRRLPDLSQSFHSTTIRIGMCVRRSGAVGVGQPRARTFTCGA